MRVAFVVRDPAVKYSLMSLSAVLKREGHHCDLILASRGKDLVTTVKERESDVVAFSCTSGRHLWATQVGRAFKKHLDVITVIGGPHATYFPEVIADDAFDVVCIGEGEGAFLELLNALEAGEPIANIQNLWVKEDHGIRKNPVRPLIADLDSLPFPDRELYMQFPFIREFQRDTFTFMTGRGCPYNCSFCYNGAGKALYKEKGPYVRRMSVENAITQLKDANNLYRLNGVIFEDDTLTTNPKWLFAFLERYKHEVGLPFSCNARGDQITQEMATRLARAGCRGVKLGVEAGDEELRRKVLKKRVTNDQFLQTAAYLKEAGIKIQSFNIVGIPTGGLESDFETLRFNTKLGVDHAWCSILNPYPGTEIREIALAEGLLTPGETAEDFFRESYFVDTALALADKRKVVNLHHFFDLGARCPFLLPLIRLLISLPLTWLYERIFKLDYALSVRRFYHIRLLPWLRFLWACRGIY
jgi:anaerobic magnesium-protoporphyrin IX monomethyl ester cyclase